jgi:predicted nuclease of predicted toxin-antitoxin system
MRIKLDENIPDGLSIKLATLGHEVDTVVKEGMIGSPDPFVWEQTQRAKRFFITQDLDFSDVRRFEPGTHEGILLVRLTNPSRRAISLYIEKLFATETVESWERCFVVATDSKVRIRTPKHL